MLKIHPLRLAILALLLPVGLSGCHSSPWTTAVVPPAQPLSGGGMPAHPTLPVTQPNMAFAVPKPTSAPHPHITQPHNPLSRPIELFGVNSSEPAHGIGDQAGTVLPASFTNNDPNCYPPSDESDQLPARGTPTGGYFIPGDELICDGGDEGIGVAVDQDWTVRGLDSEDTIGHFDTLDGERRIQASNRVCIYAPRFGSVRKTYGISSNANVQQLAGVDSQVAMVEIEEVDITSTTLQNLQPRGQVGSKAPSTYRERTRGMELENRVASSAFKNRFSLFEDLSIIRHGIFDQDEKARLAEGLSAAESWGRIEAPQAVIDNLTVDSIGTGVPAAETVLVEKPEGKPELRIVKVASAKDALPGDIIEFTLRFDNVGNEKVGNVTLLDHLSPRLEVIDGSAESNVEAEFFVTEQNQGTQIFRAEIVAPVLSGQGGIVRFKCRVR